MTRERAFELIRIVESLAAAMGMHEGDTDSLITTHAKHEITEFHKAIASGEIRLLRLWIKSLGV